MPFTIVVDGPNFLNDLDRYGKTKDYIMDTLSFPILQDLIQTRLRREGLHSHPFISTEFICSDKEQLGPLTKNERIEFLNKLKRERGVHVREIKLSSKSREEKGVDMSVFATMLEMGSPTYDVVLIGRDRDYVPAIKELTRRAIHTVVVGFDDERYEKIRMFLEQINVSYLFIDVKELLEAMEKRILMSTSKKRR